MGINTLIRKLRDLSPETRCKAAMNLGELGAEEAIPALLRAIQKDENENVRSVVAEALGTMGATGEAVEVLIEVMNEDASERVRASVAWALERIAKKLGHANLEELLQSLGEK